MPRALSLKRLPEPPRTEAKTGHVLLWANGEGLHAEFRNSATTGGLDGWAAGDTSTNTPLQTGYVTGNPTANGVAAQVHTVGQASAHSDHSAQSHSAHSGGAVDAHSVGQANQHASQTHTGTAVDTSAHLPPAIAVYLWERTA